MPEARSFPQCSIRGHVVTWHHYVHENSKPPIIPRKQLKNVNTARGDKAHVDRHTGYRRRSKVKEVKHPILTKEVQA